MAKSIKQFLISKKKLLKIWTLISIGILLSCCGETNTNKIASKPPLPKHFLISEGTTIQTTEGLVVLPYDGIVMSIDEYLELLSR